MTARSFTFGASRTAMFILIDAATRIVTRARDLPRRLAHAPAGGHRRFTERRQLRYLDDRMLRDLGLRRDQFPAAARERLQDMALYLHF